MRIRIGGPVPLSFQMNGLMVAGVAIGALGVAVWTLHHFGLLPVGPPWTDISLGTALVGISLYFLGRIVDLVTRFRRKT